MDQAKKDYLGKWFYKADEDINVIDELLSREPEHLREQFVFMHNRR